MAMAWPFIFFPFLVVKLILFWVAGTRWPVLVQLDFVRTKLILNVLYYEKLVPSGVFFFKGNW
jgi:hypothetical protein